MRCCPSHVSLYVFVLVSSSTSSGLGRPALESNPLHVRVSHVSEVHRASSGGRRLRSARVALPRKEGPEMFGALVSKAKLHEHIEEEASRMPLRRARARAGPGGRA